MAGVMSKLGALMASGAFKRLKKNYFEYDNIGGAPFLGLKGLVVKAHGSSDEYLFYFTIKQAEEFVENKAVEKMKEEFEKFTKKDLTN